MPILHSAQLGAIEYPEEHVLHFPLGLPAFEDETRFLPVERPGMEPIVFLQSLQRPDLAFPTLPVRALDPAFELALTEDELHWLSGEPPTGEHRLASSLSITEDLIALAIVTISADGITANLRAPVVVNQRTRLGIQAIQAESNYSLQHPVGGPHTPAGGQSAAEAGTEC